VWQGGSHSLSSWRTDIAAARMRTAAAEAVIVLARAVVAAGAQT
jgi:hypothetical protein